MLKRHPYSCLCNGSSSRWLLAHHCCARGLGVGTKLLDYALDYTKNTLWFSVTSLYVANTNTSAQKLYERIGFEVHRSKKSLITQVLFHEKIWNYMTKNHGTEKIYSKLVMKNGWWLGFIGLLGVPHVRMVALFFTGQVPAMALLGLLWFLWFTLFIPLKRK